MNKAFSPQNINLTLRQAARASKKVQNCIKVHIESNSRCDDSRDQIPKTLKLVNHT